MAGKYTRSKIDTSSEENILIGVIMSTSFCRDFTALIQDDLTLLKSKFLRIPISWCLVYYKTYNKAPQESIMEIFLVEKDNLNSDEEVEFVEDALENVNSRYVGSNKKFDSDLIFTQTELYIRSRSLQENTDKIKGLLSQNKVLEAENTHAEFKRKEKGDMVGVGILKDMDAVDDMFNEEDSLFTMGGALGELMGGVFKGDLCYVGGPSKASKTWSSMELALMCVSEGLNVGWWSLEMSAKLMNKRFASRIAGGSFKDIAKKIYIPFFDENNNIDYTREKVKRLTPKVVKRKYQLFQRQNENGKLVIYDATTSGNTVSAIKNSITTAEEFDDIKYDVIFIDQLNLIKTFGVKEKRHALDNIALEIKRDIAQELNTLVFSPVQYNREALKKDTNDEASISEAYSLFSHASLLVSLNQSKEERERGLLRITCSGRHSNYSGVVLVLQCLDLGRAIMDSRWLNKVPNYNEIITGGGYDENDIADLEDL